MSDDTMTVEEAENSAPLLDDAPLPMSVPTLRHIPADRRVQYGRHFDGSFRLRFIRQTDKHSMMEYNDLIAAGKLKALPDGVTPESIAAERRAQEAKAQAILDKLAKQEAEGREREKQAAYEKAQRELERRFG